jgi:signal transduction histidine kinase
VNLAVLSDITDRVRAAEHLRKSREQFRELAERARLAREEERTRLSRELHDQLGQTLSGLKMDLAWVGRLMEQGNLASAKAKIAALMSDADGTIEMVRRIATELRPAVLDRLGLVAAIEWQAEEFAKRTGIRCRVIGADCQVVLDQNQATGVFRILQEMLTNVLRHAGATSVTVTVRKSRGRFGLHVVDNGRGIAPDVIDSDRSLGLIGMRERAALLGGELVVRRRIRGGTSVHVIIPVRPRTAPALGAAQTAGGYS